MMSFQNQHSPRTRNKNLEGAAFLDADNRKIFGLISIDGEDRRIQAIVDMDRNAPIIRGGVDFERRFYDLELRSVSGTGNQPAWQGYLINRADQMDKYHLVGWINTSTSRGVRYLRLRAERVGLPRGHDQKTVLDAWSVLTGQDRNQIRLF